MSLKPKTIRRDIRVAYTLLFKSLIREMENGYTEHRLMLFNNLYRFIELIKYEQLRDDTEWRGSTVIYYGAPDVYKCFAACTPPEFTNQTFIEFLQHCCEHLSFHSPFTIDVNDLTIFKSFLTNFHQALKDSISIDK